MAVEEVWNYNFHSSFHTLASYREQFPYISVDMEFPGFLQETDRDALESIRYADLKFNVDNLKPIQVGLTLGDSSGHVLYTWQFNLSGFNVRVDPSSAKSIELLGRSGIDFDRILYEGVKVQDLARSFMMTFVVGGRNRLHHWFTFHGLYDLAYIIKMITNAPLPDTLPEFLSLVRVFFGRVYDLKMMAKSYDGLMGGEIGLLRMSSILDVDASRIRPHQAGHDSLLISKVFSSMKRNLRLVEEEFTGQLYGLSSTVRPSAQNFNVMVVSLLPNPVFMNYNMAPSPPPPIMPRPPPLMWLPRAPLPLPPFGIQ
ncbi:hypothetical protein QJS04_geneDACA009461 [Acorus gramineus]|uniref:poly(A)-specific ribonuclease n=1 Tax=Acorus gramineus TaxID=55184 RepID=A0AAV9AF05_ACOGR|nr:hypothetical protein QJS04_geneDACA009461 [Acorus gramineus]